ncbi:MAG TPA: phosphotransferase [Myxococcaceae bacterium]|nr:phosphotransferase [Myxococcaceae bacterium]
MHSEQALRDQVAMATGRPQDGAPIVQLKGDASNRSYLRVGHWPDSHVVMVMPPGPQKSEEASKGGPPDELPFVNVHRYLEGLGVRVPRILRYDPGAAMMVLEDLGDLTFERALDGAPREVLYGRAIDLLARMRAVAEARPDPRCLAFTRAFDEELYTWELRHFREYGLEAWSGKVPTAAEQAQLERAFAGIAHRLAAAPRGFTHRDYQSRNLMMTHGDLVVIDFQDALQGPWQYDLVALLRDSYVELEPGLVEAMIDRWLAAYARASGRMLERREFRRFFDLLTVQRKLKDAARFEFIHRVKKNPSFLPSIPASLRYARAAMERLSDDLDVVSLREVAVRYVPELR